MVLTVVLIVDATGDSAQAELPEDNRCASPSTVTSSATLPMQWQAWYSGEGVSTRSVGSLLKEPQMTRKVLVEEHASSSTDPVEAPAKEPAMAPPSAVEFGEDDR